MSDNTPHDPPHNPPYSVDKLRRHGQYARYPQRRVWATLHDMAVRIGALEASNNAHAHGDWQGRVDDRISALDDAIQCIHEAVPQLAQAKCRRCNRMATSRCALTSELLCDLHSAVHAKGCSRIIPLSPLPEPEPIPPADAHSNDYPRWLLPECRKHGVDWFGQPPKECSRCGDFFCEDCRASHTLQCWP